MITPKSQNGQILLYLQEGNTITPLEALDKFNCWALSSRISDLKNSGFNIDSELIHENGKQFARYSLVETK